jgi:hypothetical protein
MAYRISQPSQLALEKARKLAKQNVLSREQEIELSLRLTKDELEVSHFAARVVLEDPPQYVKDAIAGCLKDGLDKGFGNLLGTGLVIQQYPEEEILAEAIEMVMVGDKTDDDHYDLKKVDSMYKELMVSS